MLGIDSTGNIVWLPQDSTGRLPIVEENSATIMNCLLLGLEGYFGNLGADKSPGEFKVYAGHVTTNVGGDGNLAHMAAPGAGKKYRVITVDVHLDAASPSTAGTVTVGTTSDADSVWEGAGCPGRAGRGPALPVNVLTTTNEAVNLVITGGAASTVYYITVVARIEDA